MELWTTQPLFPSEKMLIIAAAGERSTRRPSAWVVGTSMRPIIAVQTNRKPASGAIKNGREIFALAGPRARRRPGRDRILAGQLRWALGDCRAAPLALRQPAPRIDGPDDHSALGHPRLHPYLLP